MIARQMQKLLASDVLYATVVRPEINDVLADNGIEGDDVPESVFLPDGTKWLDEAAVSAALGSVSGSTASATPGVHGLGLLGTSVNGTELVAESTTAVTGEETPEVEVQVQNQGESTENGVTVSVTVSGGTHPAGDDRQHRRRRNRDRLDPADPGADGRSDARSRRRNGARRAGLQKQRSQLHGRIRIGGRPWPRCGSPTSDRPGPSPRTPCARRFAADEEFEPLRTPTVHDAILAVERGEAERALVPFENSIEGSVRSTLDTLAFEAERGDDRRRARLRRAGAC